MLTGWRREKARRRIVALRRWPRQIHWDGHYLLHRVAKVRIRPDGSLAFTLSHANGREYSGPCYVSWNRRPIQKAPAELRRHSLAAPEEVRFLIAYHCGAFPNGVVTVLLGRLDDAATHADIGVVGRRRRRRRAK